MKKNTLTHQIWQKIIKLFNKIGLDYILVGGAALAVHGLPRTTLDIDIYTTSTEDSIVKLFAVSTKLGLSCEQRAVLNIKHSPALFTNQWLCFSFQGQDILDVFLSERDVFSKLYKNSEQKKDKNIAVRVASLDDLIAIKKTSGRKIDLADIELIKEAQKIHKKFKF